jgi:hypothetical protein
MNRTPTEIKHILKEVIANRYEIIDERQGEDFLKDIIIAIEHLENRIELNSKLATPSYYLENKNKQLEQLVEYYKKGLKVIGSRFVYDRRKQAIDVLRRAKFLWSGRL